MKTIAEIVKNADVEEISKLFYTTEFKCVMSAPTKEELIKMINEYFYSDNCTITDDGEIYITKTEQALGCLYMVKNKRHCVYSIV